MAKSRNHRRHKSARRTGETSGGGGGGGVMTSLRGGFKSMTASDRKARTPGQRALDIAFWVLVLAAVLFFAFGNLGR